MKIIATVRTRNEENNIERFCRSYLDSGLADAVYVADGGSEDATVEIAESIDGVTVREFEERVEMDNGLWRNPHGKHINFLIDWAFDDGADWIVFDDCDCVPNYVLKKYGRAFFFAGQFEFIYVTRIYFYGPDKHCPVMAQPRGKGIWEPSLWAWSKKSGLRAREKDPTKHEFVRKKIPAKGERYQLYPPYALLHRGWPDQETIDRKLKFYRESGQHPTMLHPNEFAGEKDDLLDWMRE